MFSILAFELCPLGLGLLQVYRGELEAPHLRITVFGAGLVSLRFGFSVITRRVIFMTQLPLSHTNNYAKKQQWATVEKTLAFRSSGVWLHALFGDKAALMARLGLLPSAVKAVL